MRYLLLIGTYVALTAYALAEVSGRVEEYPAAGIHKILWRLIIVLLPIVGAVLWFVFSRRGPRRKQSRGPVAPDEDPDFLRKLDEEARKRRRERDQRNQNEG